MEYTPSSLNKRYSPDDLYRHCIVTRKLRHIPEGWRLGSLGDLWIGTHQGLAVMECGSAKANFNACFIGYVIDPRCSRFNQPSAEHIDSFEMLEHYLDELSGRFVCVATDGKTRRLYLDASGSYSMMYDSELQIVASSSMLIPYAPHNSDQIELIKTLLLHSRNGIYPFGLTSRKNINRVLPNHYLSLDDWQVVRHWPILAFVPDKDTEKLARRIGERIKSTMFAVLKAGYRPYMSLTAGVDSRTLLACVYERKDQIQCFTWELPDNTAQQDIKIASEIADEHKLKYQVFNYTSAQQKDVERWLYRTSVSVGEIRGQDLTTTVASMDFSQPYFAGNVSEVSRGVFWRDHDNDLQDLTAEEVVKRLNAPDVPVILKAADNWLAGLPEFLSFREKLDFVYLEQRVGCWASEIGHGHACGPFHIYPFSNRRIFEWMLSSNDDYVFRKTKGIIKEIIQQQQPSLMQWEFNGGELRQ